MFFIEKYVSLYGFSIDFLRGKSTPFTKRLSANTQKMHNVLHRYFQPDLDRTILYSPDGVDRIRVTESLTNLAFQFFWHFLLFQSFSLSKPFYSLAPPEASGCGSKLQAPLLY